MERLDVLLMLLGFFTAINSWTTNGEFVPCTTNYHGGGMAAVSNQSPEWPKQDLSNGPSGSHTMTCDSARLQGRRKYQEDRIFCNLEVAVPFYGKNGLEEVQVGLVAVFDGHGGAEASEMASKLLLDYFLFHIHFIRHEAYSFAFSKCKEISFLFKEEDDMNQLNSSLVRFKCGFPLILGESMRMQFLKEALVRTIRDIDLKFSKEASNNNLISGSTATVVLLLDDHVLVAYVGDSKALLCSEKFYSREEVEGTLLRELRQKGRRISYKDLRLAASDGLTRLYAEELTRDHHPDQVDERSRIEAAGGHVVDWAGVPRVNGQLAVSRSIGDVKFKSYGVISMPEVMDWRHLTGKDSYLVVSSDGIYEKLTAQDVCDLLPQAHSKGHEILKLFPSCDQYQSSAECIVKTAFEEGSMDNLSAVVLPLKSTGLSKNLQDTRSNNEELVQ